MVASGGREDDEAVGSNRVDAVAVAARSAAAAAADPGGGVAFGVLADTEAADSDAAAGDAEEGTGTTVAGNADSARIWAGGMCGWEDEAEEAAVAAAEGAAAIGAAAADELAVAARSPEEAARGDGAVTGALAHVAGLRVHLHLRSRD